MKFVNLLYNSIPPLNKAQRNFVVINHYMYSISNMSGKAEKLNVTLNWFML